MLRLRQTILNDYLTCPYKCYKAWGEVGVAGKYDLEESPGNIYAKIGVVFHKVMEEVSCYFNIQIVEWKEKRSYL